jgi:hypothetical protein
MSNNDSEIDIALMKNFESGFFIASTQPADIGSRPFPLWLTTVKTTDPQTIRLCCRPTHQVPAAGRRNRAAPRPRVLSRQRLGALGFCARNTAISPGASRRDSCCVFRLIESDSFEGPVHNRKYRRR